MITAVILMFSPAAIAAPESVSHYWESKSLEPLNGVWVKRQLDLRTSQFTLSFFYYDSPLGGDPVLEQTMKGKASTTQSPLNSKAYDINFSVSSGTLLLRKNIPQLKNMKIDSCVKVGVPTDILTVTCGGFDKLQGSRTLFNTLLVLDDQSALLGSSLWLPTSASLRPLSFSIYPLVKK